MIVIKNTEPKNEVKCSHCGAILQYCNEDVHDILEGLGFTCPVCGNEVIIEELDYSHPHYPKNFYKFGSGYKCTNEEIQNWCNEAMKYLAKENVGAFCEFGTGDTKVVAYKYEDEIIITIAKDYEEYSHSTEED